MNAGFIGSEYALADHLHDEGVIFRHLVDGMVANEVQAAIADVGDIACVAEEGEAGAGGAHAVKLRVLSGLLEDDAVGLREGGGERFAGRGILLVEDTADDFDGKLTGDFPALVTAHAVGDHGEAAFLSVGGMSRRAHQTASILVGGALATGVAQESHGEMPGFWHGVREGFGRMRGLGFPFEEMPHGVREQTGWRAGGRSYKRKARRHRSRRADQSSRSA